MNGDYEVAFRLKQPQPAFLALLASGYSPIYPCHVPPRATYPPSAAVRQRSIARITFNWSRLMRPLLASRQAGP
jgi:ABC-type transport system substrate-binding protein